MLPIFRFQRWRTALPYLAIGGLLALITFVALLPGESRAQWASLYSANELTTLPQYDEYYYPGDRVQLPILPAYCRELQQLCQTETNTNNRLRLIARNSGLTEAVPSPVACTWHKKYCTRVRSSSSSSSCPIRGPICGTDGKTYVDPCQILYGNTGVGIAYSGSCTPTVPSPVCQSQGSCRYGNTCRAGTVCSGYPDYQCYPSSCIYTTRNPTYPVSSSSSSRMCNCNFEYNPVCGTTGKTYSNSCQALCAGETLFSSGSCSQQSSSLPYQYNLFSRGMYTTCSNNSGVVCGSDNSTYINECAAQEAGASVIYYSACVNESASYFLDQNYSHLNDANCACSTVTDPVCTTTGTMMNECMARCTGMQVLYRGSCYQ